MDAKAGNPFFRSLNQNYGESWQSTGGVAPHHLEETPDYKDLVSAQHSKRRESEFVSHESG